MAAARFVVTGKVQGVLFRASAQRQARGLGLRGFARNLPDGGVEVLAVGADDAIDELAQWLRLGPSRAQVELLERFEAHEHEAGEDFDTR